MPPSPSQLTQQAQASNSRCRQCVGVARQPTFEANTKGYVRISQQEPLHIFSNGGKYALIFDPALHQMPDYAFLAAGREIGLGPIHSVPVPVLSRTL